jgi:hypothetical protein
MQERGQPPTIDNYLQHNWGKDKLEFVPEDQFPPELQGAPWQLS